MSVRERVKRYKASGGGAGLVRVEVMVPPSGRASIIEHAARLRSEYRQSGVSSELTALHQEAMEKFGARLFWNMRPSATPSGLKIVAAQLRKYGGMDAWRLADRIKAAIDHAA